MMELTALDVRYAARELQAMAGAKVEKIVQSDVDKRDVLFTLYLPGHDGKIHLRFLLPALVCTQRAKADRYPQVPPGFAMFLRKYVGGGKLVSAEQSGADRVLRLTFGGKAGTWILIAELLPPGNMILIDEPGNIKNLLENQHYKDRNLRGGIPYVSPPPAFDIATASDADIAQRIVSSERDNVASTLAIALGLGGAYAQEACARAGVPAATAKPTQREIERLITAVRAMRDLPMAPHRDDKRVYPFALQSRQCEPCEQASFLAAIGATVMGDTVAEPVSGQAAKPKKDKLQAMLDAQEANLVALRGIIATEQGKADMIYNAYATVKGIIDAAQDARRRKADVAHELKAFPQVKRYDNATAIVELELETDE